MTIALPQFRAIPSQDSRPYNPAPTRPDHTIVAMPTFDSAQSIAIDMNDTSIDEHATGLSANVARAGLQELHQALEAVIIAPAGNTACDELVLTIEHLVRGNFDDARATATPGSPAEHIVLNIESAQSLEPLSRAHQITDLLGDLLGKLGRNEFEGDLGRWASNLTISWLSRGLVTGILTTARQLIGFALEKSLQGNAATPLTRNVIGAISLMIGPALNIIGAIRDECNGTANQQTRLARLATLTLSMAALVCAAAVPQALPALASFGPQMAFYSFATDMVNLFLPVGDNSKPTPEGAAATGGLNGALQFLAFTAMSNTAPMSGPGYAMSAGSKPSTEDAVFTAQLTQWLARAEDAASSLDLSPEQQATEILESLAPVVGHDLLRGVYNAGADVASQVLGGEIMHALQPEKDPTGFRLKFLPPRIPTAEQVTNQFLNTNAIRTSMSETIIATVVCASRYFSSLPISKADVDHIVNALVAAVVFAGRPAALYVNAGNKPAPTQHV